jgi:hypothetical protein
LPALDRFSSFFRRRDKHTSAIHDHVSSLEEHKQSAARRLMPVDGSTIDANVKSNDCDATDQSLCHIETSRGLREGSYGFCTAITCVDEHDGCHDSSIDSRGEARVSRCSHNFSEVAAMATSDGGGA